MTKFIETQEAADFIATAASRETSLEIMQAIAFFSRNLSEAEALWNGDGLGTVCDPSDLWERVTNNGLRDAADFCWGASGTSWWAHLNAIDQPAMS
jgi:hypothetical protein